MSGSRWRMCRPGCGTSRPDYPPYRGLTGVKLREILEREHGIKVASTGNRYPVDPTKIRARIAWRADRRPRRGVGLARHGHRPGVVSGPSECSGRRPHRPHLPNSSQVNRGERAGGEEVKNLTPNFGPHPDLITASGRLVGLQIAAARAVASQSSDLAGLDADRELRVVLASAPYRRP